jgi:hypothetical protein
VFVKDGEKRSRDISLRRRMEHVCNKVWKLEYIDDRLGESFGNVYAFWNTRIEITLTRLAIPYFLGRYWNDQ